MGIEYASAVVVGLPRKEFKDEESLQQLIDSDTLEAVPPYYDGNDSDDAIVGLVYKRSPDYSPTRLEWEEPKIDALKSQFKDLTGQEANVYLTPVGW